MSNSYKKSGSSLFTKKINYIGKKLLETNQNSIRHNNFFSVIFISDTHSQQLDENTKKNSSLDQYCLLLKKIKLYENITCIVHGGDAIHGFANNPIKSNTQLKQFIASTKNELYENTNPLKIIPFVMNEGNHDYTCNNFNKLVGENSDIIKAKKHYLDIILLYTGYMHNGFSDLTSFKKQLSYVENKIKKEHKMVKFIIDMHIPPQIGAFVKYSNHTLNSELTTEFIKFINKYQSRIISVTTHHIHNFNTSDFSLPVYIHPEGNIPIYLTSSGGNKDSNKHSKSQCKCLKMNFVTDKNKINLKDVEEIVL